MLMKIIWLLFLSSCSNLNKSQNHKKLYSEIDKRDDVVKYIRKFNREKLLEILPSINICEYEIEYSKDKFTILHYTLYFKMHSLAEFILNYISSLNNFDFKSFVDKKTSFYKRTALHFSVGNNYLDIVEKLIDKYSSDIDPIDLYNNTPLYYAISNYSDKMVELLLRKGANKNVLVKNKTLVELAKEMKQNFLFDTSNPEYKRLINIIRLLE